MSQNQNGAFSAVRTQATPMGERYIVAPDGECVIPASRRPDGTLRKEIKVRPGYIPLEEQSRYRSKGAEFKALEADVSAHPVGYTPSGHCNPASGGTSSKKKGKKKVGTLAAAKAPQDSEPTYEVELPAALQHKSAIPSCPPRESSPAPDQSEAKQKKLITLQKKLAEIQDLERKRAEGGSLNLAQSEKVSRKKKLQAEIGTLQEGLAA